MRLILTHEKTDFDAVASQLGAKKLFPDAVALLPNHLNRNVQQFLNLYWDALPFVAAEEWQRRVVKEVVLVDTQVLGNIRGLAKSPEVYVFDHHLGLPPRPGWSYEVEAVGATTTLLVEKLQATGVVVSAEEATLLLLGIYEDTGSLSYDTTTARDVRAAAWLLEQEAQLHIARRFLNIALSESQQALYTALLHRLEWLKIEQRPIVLAAAAAPVGFDDEISSVAHRLRDTLSPDALFVVVQLGDGTQVVARSSSDEIDAGAVCRALGGGGHARAAAAMIVGGTIEGVLVRIRQLLQEHVRPALRVESIMSYGVQTLSPAMTVADALKLMRRLGHEGYPVFDPVHGRVLGLVTRRQIDRAVDHEMGHLPVTRIMQSGNVTVRPDDTLERVQELMLSEGWGQIPVVALAEDGAAQNLPIGIVTRTDLLAALFRPLPDLPEADMRHLMAETLSAPLWGLIRSIGEVAGQLQMPVYVVGGLVRDLLLAKRATDLDVVVEGDAIALVNAMRLAFGGETHSHDRFGTAKWILGTDVWQAIGLSVDENWDGLVPDDLPPTLDFVTARKEFYRRPTVLPEVEPGSIKLDLHRRDFTINTLAIRIDGLYLGQLLDFYGGRRDLERRLIRVLHSLSFIDDPTRILRAVRLEQRLGFDIEEGTAELIAAALPMLARVTGDRIRGEIELALTEADPVRVMERLQQLDVLEQIHPGLGWPEAAAAAFRRVTTIGRSSDWRHVYDDGDPVFYYFAVWLSFYDPSLQLGVADRLRVRKRTHTDLVAVNDARRRLNKLAPDARASEVASVLRGTPERVLLTLRMLDLAPHINRWLERMITEWRHQSLAISGEELHRLGVPSGPLFGQIRNRLLAAWLDGEIRDSAGERTLLEAMLSEERPEG